MTNLWMRSMYLRSIHYKRLGSFIGEFEFEEFTRNLNKMDSLYKSKCLDCQLTNWEEWGACIDKQRTRQRKVLREASNGGTTCDNYDCIQTEKDC